MSRSTSPVWLVAILAIVSGCTHSTGQGEYKELQELEMGNVSESETDHSDSAPETSPTESAASAPVANIGEEPTSASDGPSNDSENSPPPTADNGSPQLASAETSAEKPQTADLEEVNASESPSAISPTADSTATPASQVAPEASLRAMSREEMIAMMEARLLGRTPGTPIEKREIKLLVPHQEFQREGPENALRITFDDIDLLKVLNMEPVPVDAVEYFPEWLKKLDGEKIILRGWMYPPLQQEGISRFMFVRDNGICCFGRLPKVYDKLGVTLREGETTAYIQNRPFDVVGTLRFKPDPDGNELLWLYRIDDAHVIDK